MSTADTTLESCTLHSFGECHQCMQGLNFGWPYPRLGSMAQGYWVGFDGVRGRGISLVVGHSTL